MSKLTKELFKVIRALEIAIHCSKKQAMLLATVVDKIGRSVVKTGNQEICASVALTIEVSFTQILFDKSPILAPNATRYQSQYSKIWSVGS